MNEKTKAILEKAWNEPRHFFFWLGMLSACGIAAVLGLCCTGLVAPTPVLSFVALVCALSLVASIPAFILAWIPPLRRLFPPLLRRRFFLLGCLLTLVALFYAVENWRGRRAWQNFKRQWEAKGERFELAAFIPPPVPDDQNFFETPLWAGLHFMRTNHTTVWSDTNWGNQVLFDVYGPRSKGAPSTVNLYKSQRTDLAAWQAFYRGTNNWFPASGGRLTNYFPVATEPQTPAADVLLALSRFEPNRRLLLEASARPRARFWINYDDVTAALLPHLSRMKASAIYLSLHSVAALKAGDRQTALADIKLSFRLLESIREEPVLVSYLVRTAMLPWTLQPIWEGLADRQWTEPELNLIQAELGKLDFLADYDFAIRSERAAALWVVDYVRAASPSALESAGLGEGAGLVPGELPEVLNKALFQLVPSGWFDQNKLSLCRMYENYLLPQVDRENGVILPAAARRWESALEAQSRRPTPYDWLDRLLLPALGRVVRRCAYAQSFADLARGACALERCRLANGQFPETLEALVPRFLGKLPHDRINGQPLKYHRTDDGHFVLYSVGWNETDDGGKVALTKKGIPDRDNGDWVWRYPAK
ncbi:MAG TPA: hypothetical protein VN829_20340 [Dongiaceae bacterium]|nr:hypothetical protein [Dongiaceae bacterium]